MKLSLSTISALTLTSLLMAAQPAAAQEQDTLKSDGVTNDTAASEGLWGTFKRNVTNVWQSDQYDLYVPFWTWHNRGFYTYAIGRLGEGVTAESFASDYAYTVEYDMVVPDYGTFPMSDDFWKVPNSWIVDVVNLSIEEMFAWIVTSPLLDAGWTYCGKIDGDETRFGKSVRRKAVSTTSAPYYMDTNNSTTDFTPEATPSLKN